MSPNPREVEIKGVSLKRGLDLIASCFALVLFSPILLLLSVVIRVKLGSPIVFRQKRPGKDGSIFTLVKFRTMTDARGSNAALLSDSERLSFFGKWLRSTSLDELPELWNVLRGDMSIVGPRPLLVEYLPLYSLKQGRRHEVRPGLTGLAQVMGRNNISWEEKFDLDVWYVDNRSLRLDCAIIFWTFKAVLKRDGISADGSATMPPFQGSE